MLTLTLALAALAQDALVVDRIAAVVTEHPIALSEVYDMGRDYITSRCQPGVAFDACIREGELEVLDTLIKFALVRQELDALEMRVTGDDVDQAIDNVIRENGFADREDLRKYVESTGARWESYRDQLMDSIRTDRFRGAVLVPRVVVTDDEIHDLYTRTKRRVDPGSATVTLDALGVLIPADANETGRAARLTAAEDVVRRLNAGELEWAQAVADYDSAGLSKVVAGRTYTKGQLQEAIDTLAFSAEVGVVNAPVLSGNVLFVVKVLTRESTAAEVQDLADVREQLRGQLFQKKLIAIEEEWYQRARRESAVTVVLGSK
ncbi:MAG: parvulin-like peptidyl-prolyl isomerase [Myxococcota bacterium]|jgi:parvulin-like peptidyl-prolyl isomerase